MENKFLFVNGLFHQNFQSLGIAYLSEAEGGVKPVVKTGFGQFMFTGIVFPDLNSRTGMSGKMTDNFGESVLFDFEISDDKISFGKMYRGRRDCIYYTFELKNGVWIGKYEGSATGSGYATCVIADAEVFFRQE